MVMADKPTTTAPERGEREIAGRRLYICRSGQHARTGPSSHAHCSPSRDRRLDFSRTLLSCGGGRQVVVSGLGVNPRLLRFPWAKLSCLGLVTSLEAARDSGISQLT